MSLCLNTWPLWWSAWEWTPQTHLFHQGVKLFGRFRRVGKVWPWWKNTVAVTGLGFQKPMPGPASVRLCDWVPQLVVWGGYGTFRRQELSRGMVLPGVCFEGSCFTRPPVLSLPVCRWKMSSSSFLLGPETLGFPKWLPVLSCHDQLYPPVIVGQSKRILVFYHSEVNWEQTRQGLKNLEEGTETKTTKTWCTHSGLDLPTPDINKKIHLPTCL